MRRYTFVVRVHPGEDLTIENLATGERVPVTDAAAIGPRIERWLDRMTQRTPGGPPVAAREEER